MKVYQELEALKFVQQFEEVTEGHRFRIYTYKDCVFVWGELEEKRMQMLYTGRSDSTTFEESKAFSTTTVQCYFDHNRGSTVNNDSVFTAAFDGNLSAVLATSFFQRLLANSTPIVDTPGVIDAFMIPTYVKTAIREEAMQRTAILPNDVAVNIEMQYESRELYNAQADYFEEYPQELRNMLRVYYMDLNHQVEVYKAIYNKTAKDAVQSLLD